MGYGDDRNGDGGTALMEAAPRQLQATAQLPADLMLMKMENETFMNVARVQPREPMKIVAQLKELIEAWPAAAEEAIYSKPVGTVTECTCGECQIKYEVAKVDKDTACPACGSKRRGECWAIKKFAEGLSIRAAESIRSIYGYTRLTTTCEMLPNGSAKLTGTIVDYAAGNFTSDTREVPRQYKSRTGEMITHAEDRFLSVVVKAEKAKLIRDVILSNTPGIIKAMYRDMCEQKLEQLVAPEIIAQKIVPAFEKYGISATQLDKIVGRPAALGWSEQERLNVRKLLVSLKNEEVTVAELLAGLNEPVPENLPTAKPAPQTTGELADKLKDKGQKTEQPNTAATSKPTEVVTEVVDESPMLADAAIEFGGLETHGQVSKCEQEWAARKMSPESRKQIADFASKARDRISEAKQKK